MLNSDIMAWKTERESNQIKISYEEYLRKDFIRRAMIVWMDTEHEVKKIYFNSSAYGTVYWNSDQGLYNCHSWETEEQAMNGSFLQRMYPTITHNGTESVDYAGRVKADVLEGFRIEKPELYETLFLLPTGVPFYWPEPLGAV